MNDARVPALVAGMALFAATAAGQAVLFDFDSLPAHSGLPAAYSVGGITASFSATGSGFSIQPANTMGFTPVGFGGNCIYPNSVFAADLRIGFAPSITAFSILYSPQELGCDDSARMRVTAFVNGVVVGTATATAANPGTWPTETLAFGSAQPFDSVVVHYDARPPTCQDWGPIFLADNMTVTPIPPEIVLVNGLQLPGGAVQFDFFSSPGGFCSAWVSTDASLPAGSWTFVESPTEIIGGHYRFSDLLAATTPVRFYRATAP